MTTHVENFDRAVKVNPTTKKSGKVTDVKKLQANDIISEEELTAEIKKQNAYNDERAIEEATKRVEDLKNQLVQAKADLKKLTGKKEKTDKGPGVISTILSLVTESGKTGISKSEILDKLVAMFPDRAQEGMEKTIQVQLPSRMSKEKKVNIVKENDRYMIK